MSKLKLPLILILFITSTSIFPYTKGYSEQTLIGSNLSSKISKGDITIGLIRSAKFFRAGESISDDSREIRNLDYSTGNTLSLGYSFLNNLILILSTRSINNVLLKKISFGIEVKYDFLLFDSDKFTFSTLLENSSHENINYNLQLSYSSKDILNSFSIKNKANKLFYYSSLQYTQMDKQFLYKTKTEASSGTDASIQIHNKIYTRQQVILALLGLEWQKQFGNNSRLFMFQIATGFQRVVTNKRIYAQIPSSKLTIDRSTPLLFFEVSILN